jgi:hypothetical protein
MANRELIYGAGTVSPMRVFCLGLVPILLAAATAAPAESQAPPSPALTYADMADLALAAPVAAHVRVARSSLLKKEQAVGVLPSHARFLVQADMVALIRGAEGLPSRIAYVVDLPRDPKGKPPRLAKGSQFLLLASPVAGHPGEVRLVAPDAQLPYSPQRAAQLRAILAEATGPEPAPRITGIGRAFHVPGAIPGESETQIFLQTAGGRPVSLNVLRRPGETPIWAVALGEIVDESAGPPARDTLLWYRLACTLPRALPPQSLAEADRSAAAAINADYRLIVDRLGPCQRSRARR